MGGGRDGEAGGGGGDEEKGGVREDRDWKPKGAGMGLGWGWVCVELREGKGGTDPYKRDPISPCLAKDVGKGSSPITCLRIPAIPRCRSYYRRRDDQYYPAPGIFTL